MPTSIAALDKTQYVRVNTAYNPMVLEAHRDSVRVVVSELKPARDNTAFHKLGGGDAPLSFPSLDTNLWVLAQSDDSSLIVTELDPIHTALHDGDNNPISSIDGALDVHDADVHTVPVNELFHRYTGVETTLAAPAAAGTTVITVVDDTGFTDGLPFQLEDAAGAFIEVTFPTIISGVGTNTWQLDRPLDRAYATGDVVEEVATNLAVIGTIGAPVSFKLIPDPDQTWHIVRFLLAMVHTTAGDDSRFGNIAGGLTNGCVLRGYNATAGMFRTFTNWKTNFDIKMDMFNLPNTDKAGAGNYGTNGRGSIRDGTGASPHLDADAGDYLELLIQDDLSTLVKFNLKGQGHIEGL